MTPTLQAQEPMLRVERIGLIFGCVLAACMMWPLRHALTDDTFVHLQVARHLAQGRGPVFNAGEHVYGCTSPLWSAILGDAMALGWNGLLVARLLGAISALATIPLFLQLMRRTVRLPALRGFATVAWAANPWMVQWAMSGMETPLAIALTLAGFVAFTEGPQWGSRPIRTGALWALAALTRPEIVFLLVLWGVLLLIDANNRTQVRRLVIGLLPPIVIYGAWLLFARLFYGTFWPRSLSVHLVEPVAFSLRALVDELRIVATTDGVLVALLAVSLVFSGRTWLARGPRSAQRALPWLWVMALPLLYVARGIPASSRYLLVLLPVLAWLAWRAADGWWLGADVDNPPRRTQATVLGFAVMALSVAVNFGVYRTQVLPEVTQSSARIKDGLEQWGNWFGQHTPLDAVIAAREVGALGFRSDRRMLDLTGLISPELESMNSTVHDPAARLAFAGIARPQFLVDRAARPFDLIMRSRYAAAITPLGRASAYVAAGEADSVYTFYRIDWSVFDTLSTRR